MPTSSDAEMGSDPPDPFLNDDGIRSPTENGVAIACGLLEASNQTAIELIYELNEQDIRDVALVLIGAQHTGIPESLETLFGDRDVYLTSLAQVKQLEGQLDVLAEILRV